MIKSKANHPVPFYDRRFSTMEQAIDKVAITNKFSWATLKLHEVLTGRRILNRLEELNRTQWLSYDDLLAFQRAKLQRVVDYAYQYVPYYQRTFKEAGFNPDDLKQDQGSLSRLPILTREIIRSNWEDLLTTQPERRRQLSKLTTSESTDKPFDFMRDTTFRDAVTADIQRHMGWAGWDLGDLQALIWGVSCKPDKWQTIRSQLKDLVWNRFQTNEFDMTDESMAVFAEKILRQKPYILFGQATCVYRFAQFIRRSPYKGVTFDGILTTTDALLPSVRKYIEETFWCRVFNRYESLELGGIACECEAHTGLHISAENNYVEILSEGRPAEPGQVGDIVVTNLNNLGMPFIRYSSGDTGAWQEGPSCPCGRSYPMLK